MSPGAHWGVAASAALAAGVSLVSILQAGDYARVPTPARHYFFNIYHHTQAETRIWVQHAVLGLGE